MKISFFLAYGLKECIVISLVLGEVTTTNYIKRRYRVKSELEGLICARSQNNCVETYTCQKVDKTPVPLLT